MYKMEKRKPNNVHYPTDLFPIFSTLTKECSERKC